MIRINLIAAGRAAGKKKAAALGFAQRLTVVCSLILIASVGAIAWRYLSLTRESSALDQEISAAQQEVQRLRSVITQVQQFEQRKAELQQRVVLIEDLRKAQTGPVHMLDQISRSLPPMLWLTQLKQVGSDVTIEGRSTTVTGVSEFVRNLEASGYFRKSIDIIDTKTEPLAQPPGELVRFILKAGFQRPGDVPPAAPTGAAPKTGG